ncbi:hypothetical protein [Paracidobacterium acidisoli]|uniref:Uncharacterized protein n=1 Tax=Paracidobacterium acidisoli TaxID=2303751 RepID=A0A372INQ6_9BACT|nr:hypothetical protein [Paracidobacterium acidisoli]MBT9331872.1 hypothetical protein [Paracidobacterium acidisoli]
MADLSVQNPSGRALRLAAALLRASGGTTASLQMPPLVGDANDTGQVGLDQPGFLQLPLSPAVFRRVRIAMKDGQLCEYELMVSAEAVATQVSQLQLSSAQTLFTMANGVIVAGKLFLIEAVSTSETQGIVCLYRLLLREAAGEWQL